MSERILNVDHKRTLGYNGRTFRSDFEVETAKTLDKMGISYEYETRKIILQEGFKCDYQKDKVRAITYTPDFQIGNILIECKGYETPEWKIKKKLLYKYLRENEPDTLFYQIHDCKKQLITALDKHWEMLGYYIQTTSKYSKNKPLEIKSFSSIAEAMHELRLEGKSVGAIVGSLTGDREYVYQYNWKLIKIE